MAPERAETRAVARLDAILAREFAVRGRVVLAFSGGLGSLILAGLARKHGDMRCVVVGTRGAADVGAALVARDFLDYRLEVLTPRPASILQTARGLRAQAPALPLADILDLVPLALVEARHPRETVLCGYALAPRSPALRRHLAHRPSRSPAPAAAAGTSRRLALRMAEELAIPDGFAAASRRSPSEGSGIGPVLRAMGHARHRSVERLLAGDIQPRDYHGP